jgi:hypothetical protein
MVLFMRLSESKKVIEEIANQVWLERVHLASPRDLRLFCEEAEGTLRNIRGEASGSMFRLVHIGRNRNIRTVLMTVDLAFIDPSVVRQCGIRFCGFTNPEENSKRKFRSYHGTDWLRVVEHIETGTFVRLHKRKLDIVTVPCFERKHAPQLTFPEPTEPKPIPKPKISLWQSLKSLFQIKGLNLEKR